MKNRYTSFIFALALVILSACNVSDDAANVAVAGDDCPEGQTLCSGACFDLDTSTEACGACGVSCEAGQICAAGACQTVCAAGYVACGDTCVNPLNNPSFCGVSDPCDPADTSFACAEGEVCSNGSCALVCADDTLLCDGQCVDPEVDRTFCGAEGNCSGGNVGATCLDTEVCDDGTCVNTCPAGSVGCDGGCIDPTTNPRFCGASGTCTGDEAGVMCAPGERCEGGQCQADCGDLLLCDGTCVDPTTNPRYCGAVDTCVDAQAGEVCNIGEACLAGTCFPTDYFLFSPFGVTGTHVHPRDLAYRVDTLVDGITMHYTLDGTDPVPGEGTTMSTSDFIDTGELVNDTLLRVVFDMDGTLSGAVALRHRTDTALAADVNTPDNFSLNGGGIITTVEPGEEVNVTFDVLLWKQLAETSAQAFYYVDGVGLIHCESLAATPPGMQKSLDLTFNAPSEPGTYFLRGGIAYADDCAALTEPPEVTERHAVVKVR
jgi:hypothetical protein